MSKISRLVVLVTSLAAVVGAMAGTAGAVTWDVTSTGNFHATAPQSTFSSTGVNLACPTTTATGSYTAGAFAGNTYAGVTGTVTVSGCSLAGQSTEATCTYRLTAFSQPTSTTVTTGNADLTCGITHAPTGVKLCHLHGAPHMVYTDGVVDQLIMTPSTLQVSGPSCWYGNNDTASVTQATFTISGNGPHIIRTA